MSDKYNASASMLGYLYQCRYALLRGIEESKTAPNLAISIERFDDVAFESNEAVVDLIQTKHHSSAGDLSDKSVDLWKTIGVWCARVDANPKLPFETKFTILTTGTAPEGSAASLLRVDRQPHQVEEAMLKLLDAAEKSQNTKTMSARIAYKELKSETRLSLVRSIIVLDNGPNIADVRADIEDTVALAAPAEKISTFVDYLEGWWFSVIIKCLLTVDSQSIPIITIRMKIDELREEFKSGKLPLDEMEFDVLLLEGQLVDERIFVKQLKSVSVSNQVLGYAIRDYYRAATQRARWARENLLLDGETQKYDNNLVHRWTREFEARKDDADLSTESGKQKCGRSIFHWANKTQVPFRNRNELWISAGSFQLLADVLHVGWHPDFEVLFNGSNADS